MTPTPPLKAVLFDLDGTLLDTAKDLAFALNQLRAEEGKTPLDYEPIRRVVSNGGNAMVKLGFQTQPDTAEHQRLYARLLALYEQRLLHHTEPFAGIQALLSTLEQLGLTWGVVTNKPSAYSTPIMQNIGLTPAYQTLVCADQVQQRKPHPESLLLACTQLGCTPQQAIYVGDHRRDIEAGHSAGMKTVAALYGYIEEGDDPRSWHADYYIEHPDELTELLHSTLS